MTDQNQQALPPLDATPKWCPDCLTYHRCKPNEQLLQALRERDEARAMYFRVCEIGEDLESALAAANRRAEEAFNKGVEAAAESIVGSSGFAPIAGDIIRQLKRPTQPEQTQKEQGE